MTATPSIEEQPADTVAPPTADLPAVALNGDGQPERLSTWKWMVTSAPDTVPPLFYFIVVFVVATGIVIGYLADSDVPDPNKWRMAVTVTVVVLIALVASAMYGRSRSAKIASAVDSIVLTLVVAMIAVAPVLLLDRGDQLLLLKFAVIGILALLPGLIYFQFLASRGEALWDEFTETLRRLDVHDFGPVPARGVLPNMDSVYRRKFEATYGRLRTTGTQMTRGRAVFPVFLLTAIVAIGWVATLEPEAVGDGHLFRAFEASGAPGLSATALQFGFAGAYFFIIQMLVRRYFQNDLKSDAYLNGVMRIVIAAIGTATIAVVFTDVSEAQLAATAFVIGVFPQTAVDLIRTVVLFPLQGLIKRHKAQYPLSDLDGMNVWYEARLLEEGVEDLQNLKTASWVQLLLNTRIPAGRLVDWVDQSHLLLHVLPPHSARRDGGAQGDRELLRRYGIRTATDLEAAFYSAREDDERSIETILDGDGAKQRVTYVVRTLAAEPVLANVRAWKEQVDPARLPATVRVASVLRTGRRLSA